MFREARVGEQLRVVLIPAMHLVDDDLVGPGGTSRRCKVCTLATWIGRQNPVSIQVVGFHDADIAHALAQQLLID